MIAPAYTAFLAQRPIVDGISDFPNWFVRVHRGDLTARTQASGIARLLRSHRIPIAIVDANMPLPPQDQRALITAYTPTARCGSAIVFAPRT